MGLRLGLSPSLHVYVTNSSILQFMQKGKEKKKEQGKAGKNWDTQHH